jgi:hypothetical protein
MKIHITENVNSIVEGFTLVPIVYGRLDLAGITDNSATHILAIDAIDSIPESMLVKFLQDVERKMRFGCVAVFGGVDLDIMARGIISQEVHSQGFNRLMSSKKAIYRNSDIKKILMDLGLSIDRVSIQGINYEIHTTRKNKNQL